MDFMIDREQGKRNEGQRVFLENVSLAFKQIVKILHRGIRMNRREKAQSDHGSKEYDSE